MTPTTPTTTTSLTGSFHWRFLKVHEEYGKESFGWSVLQFSLQFLYAFR